MCSHRSRRRKQGARKRGILGVQTRKLLQKLRSQQGTAALPEGALTMPSMRGGMDSCTAVAKPATPPRSATSSPPPPPPILSLDPSSADPSPNELTHEELRAVARGSLDYLRLKAVPFYVHHLVTATL